MRQPIPDLAGQDVHLTVVHTADLHSRFFPYYFAPGQIDKGLGLIPKTGQDFAVVGGIGRVSTVVKCIRGIYTGPPCDALEPTTSVRRRRARSTLDSGDIFEGAPVFNTFNGEVEMRAMSQLGLTAMALGNHEFDKGSVEPRGAVPEVRRLPHPRRQLRLRPTPTDYDAAQARRHHRRAARRSTSAGCASASSASATCRRSKASSRAATRSACAPSTRTQAITNAVQVLRPQVDLLAIISHLGLDEDEGVAASTAESQDQNTAVAIDGVDIIFGGHLHIVLNPPKDIGHVYPNDGHVTGHTVLCHSGAFAKYVGRLDLVVHVADPNVAGDKSGIKAYTYRIIPIDDSIPSDPAMDNMLEPYQLKMNAFLNLNQVYAVVPCSVNDAGNCPKTQRNDNNGGDSQLGNLVATRCSCARASRPTTRVTNSLGIRADFESGPLNLEEMYNVFPFDNTITTMELSGDETQQMLDFVAARSSERGCRTQAQVSGIYMRPRLRQRRRRLQHAPRLPRRPAPRTSTSAITAACPTGTFNGTSCTPLNPYGEYRVAVNDYIAAGGSGFSVLQRNTTKFNTGISLRDALVDYIRTLPNRCTDPTMYTNVVGVNCKDKQAETYDCTTVCNGDANFANCQTMGMTPSKYDYTGVACLGPDVNAHDGRIQMFTTAETP